MLPNLPAIETRAGRIAIGAEVKSTRYPVPGLVTAIIWAGYFYAIQVNNRHSDDAAHYKLLSAPTYQGFNYGEHQKVWGSRAIFKAGGRGAANLLIAFTKKFNSGR
ncbi:hypothetical protein [Hymenobacter antarcticus]|uniref:Uncharacterized protein n=1 Tax=Hymenobacter antarcticus TaxID=486270 RepID=A0ABP7QC14_9BACT